jgi:hypothetical protein
VSDIKPVKFTWTGEEMVPWPQFAAMCDEQFVVGEHYRMQVEEDRSSASHRHFFAAVREAWENLPEKYAGRFPDWECLRKWCLIKCGYANEAHYPAPTPSDAILIAKIISEVDPEIVAVPHGDTVTIYTAKSQAVPAMNREEFQRSKQDVLDLLSEMLGTTVGQLKKNAGRAA